MVTVVSSSYLKHQYSSLYTHFDAFIMLNGSQLAKMKKFIPTCYCHEIYREEAVGLKSSKYTFKNFDVCEYVKFGAISLKIDIL